MVSRSAVLAVPLDSPDAYINRELSWLAFARRVLDLARDPELPLLERVKFAGILGMLHDEFFMKRMGGLEQQVARNSTRLSSDGRTPAEELAACRAEIRDQMRILASLMNDEIRPSLARAGIPIFAYADLDESQRTTLREDFAANVVPILTPLAVDAEHPFPFISGQGLNMAIQFPDVAGRRERFVRLKVPTNRPRWVPVPSSSGFVPLEEIIAANLDLVLVGNENFRHYLFRVTRDIRGESDETEEEIDESEALLPGSIVRQVSRDLKARRFAGIARLSVSSDMPPELQQWLARQLNVGLDDVYAETTYLGLSDLLALRLPSPDSGLTLPHEPADHPRLRTELRAEPGSIFEEIRRGDILLHHPYHSFETSVLRFLREAAEDAAVVAIKLTIYRTSSDSPIIRALADAARRGKQVAVLVEITARFDEAPNIAWGQLLEREGVHVSYGVEKLKTHVKLALVVRDEGGKLRRYAHVGTGNYHTGTARIYQDLGLLTADPTLCRDVALLFNQLTGALPPRSYERLIVAPHDMRTRFTDLIRAEAEHALAGRPARIRAKMNQLQDGELIRELYKAGQAGVAISLGVRGLCCLRPGVPGLSENIEVFSVVGRFLEHARIYEFGGGRSPRYFLGSADWMKRNLDRRVESVAPVEDPELALELGEILDTYDRDNYSRWDCGPDGIYTRRRPAAGEPRASSQELFLDKAARQRVSPPPHKKGRRTKKD
jgi:polyphosphate kinase